MSTYLVRNTKEEKTYMVHTKDIEDFFSPERAPSDVPGGDYRTWQRVGRKEDCVWKRLESDFAFLVDYQVEVDELDEPIRKYNIWAEEPDDTFGMYAFSAPSNISNEIIEFETTDEKERELRLWMNAGGSLLCARPGTERQLDEFFSLVHRREMAQTGEKFRKVLGVIITAEE